jgi:hypothetical protein
MPKTYTDYSAIANDPTVAIAFPEVFIDLKVILMSLRFELAHNSLYFNNHFSRSRAMVIIPSLSSKFQTYYKDGFLYLVFARKLYRLPCELDDEWVSEQTIDILVALLMHLRAHRPNFRTKYGFSSKPFDTSR